MPTPRFLLAIRRRLPLTREGLGWFVLTIAMILTGLLKSINLITLFGCFLLAIGPINLWLAWRQVRGLRIERTIPDFLIAGSAAPWSLQALQSSPRVRKGVAIDEPGPGTPFVCIVDLQAEAMQTFERTVVPAHRGLMPLKPIRVRSSYPFGLAEVERRSSGAATSIAIAPRLGQLNRSVLRRWLSQRHLSTGAVRTRPFRHPTGQTEFHGLRPFRTGDSPRLIHWRTSARRGELMVREFEEFPNDDLVLIVDLALTDLTQRLSGKGSDPLPSRVQNPQSEAESLQGPGGLTPCRTVSASDAFERMLSLAATIAWEWCRQKGDWLTVVIVGTAVRRITGPTGAGVRAEVLQALAAAEPTTPATSHLLLSVGTSELFDRLAEDLGDVLYTVDVGTNAEAEFFEIPRESLAPRVQSESVNAM